MESVNSPNLSFQYEAFGLKIHSEIKLPELRPLKSEKSDLNIYFGKIDLSRLKVLHKGLSSKVTKDAIYRFWDEIGKFEITEDTIRIEKVLGVNKIVLRTFLLGTVFATHLRLKGLFVLHASSINLNGNAIAFSGFKGHGKSTTASAFYNEGYPIVADDYVAIDWNNINPLVYPGFPSLRLSNESRKVVGFDLFKSNDKNDKTYISVPNFFSNHIIPLKKIYFLKRGDELKITDLPPQKAFIELIKNTFGIYMLSRSELPDNFFQCEQLVKKVNIATLKIPDSIGRISEVVKIIKEDINKF